jgi:hypothetical protein
MLTPAQHRSFMERDADVAAMMTAAQKPMPLPPAEQPKEPKDHLLDHRNSERGYRCRSMMIGGAYAVPLCNRPFEGLIHA